MNIKTELFFNAGDFEKQENFIIRPANISNDELDLFLQAICQVEEMQYKNEGILLFNRLEKHLQENNIQPDPTKYKLCSNWCYAQLATGAIIFRIGYDGRRETGSNRRNNSFEGAFLRGYNLHRGVKKYSKQGRNIIEEIGKMLPAKIESILVEKNKEVFDYTKNELAKSNSKQNLYNAFYVACWGHELSLSKTIDVDFDIPRLNLASKMRFR